MSGISPILPKRDALVATSLGIVTAIYTWALLRSFGSIPFASSILIFYLFPLLAAVIAAGFGWEKFSWKTGGAIALALAGLALAFDVGGGNLHLEGVALAFLAAIGLAIVIVFSSRVFGKGDARPLTLYMAATACVILLMLCAISGDFALPQTHSGWTGFAASTALYGFAMIAFFIAVSMIGPVRASLLLRRRCDIRRSRRYRARSGADAGPSFGDRACHACTDRRNATKIEIWGRPFCERICLKKKRVPQRANIRNTDREENMRVVACCETRRSLIHNLSRRVS